MDDPLNQYRCLHNIVRTWNKGYLFKHVLQLSKARFETSSVSPDLFVCRVVQRLEDLPPRVCVQGGPLAEGEGRWHIGRVLQGKVDYERDTMENLIF